jgi:hypothetical protein
MNDKAAVLADVCAVLSADQPDKAGVIPRERYPFVSLVRAWSEIRESLARAHLRRAS